MSTALAAITLPSMDAVSYLCSPLMCLLFKASLTSFEASQNPVQKEGPAVQVAFGGYGNRSSCWYITLDGVVLLLTIITLAMRSHYQASLPESVYNTTKTVIVLIY